MAEAEPHCSEYSLNRMMRSAVGSCSRAILVVQLSNLLNIGETVRRSVRLRDLCGYKREAASKYRYQQGDDGRSPPISI